MELPEILPLPKTNSLVNRFRFFNSKITYAFFLKDHIHSLNSFLKYLRAHDIVSSVFWKVPGVQYLIDDICFEM
jgi:hypothetical protein